MSGHHTIKHAAISYCCYCCLTCALLPPLSLPLLLLPLLQFMMVGFTRADDADPQAAQAALAGMHNV
jgi:hypothetical protein